MPTSPIATHAKRLQDISRPRRKAQEQAEFDAEQARIYQELQIYGRVLSPTERVFQPYTDPVKGGEEEGAFRAMKDTLTAGFAGGGLSAVRPGGLAKLFDPRVPASEIHALYGVKRYPPLYHGTDAPEEILEGGFKKGSSAELKLSGTSLSQDPMVSLSFASGDIENVLRATPDLPPSQVRNLRPSEYLRGEHDLISNKPNALLFDEAETFVRRPSIENHPLKQELAEKLRLLEGAKTDEMALKQSLHDALMDNDIPAMRELRAQLELVRDVKIETNIDIDLLKRKISELPNNSAPITARRLSVKERQVLGEQSEKTRGALEKARSTKSDFTRKELASRFASAIRSTKGNRGMFDKVMRQIVDRADGLSPATDPLVSKARDANLHFTQMQRLVRVFRDRDLFDPSVDAMDLEFREAREFLGKKVPKFPNVRDVNDTLDAVHKVWVRERDALAKQIESQGKIPSVAETGIEWPLSTLENRVRAIVERTASRNRTGASADPVATARAKLTIDDVDALNEAGMKITADNVKDITNADLAKALDNLKIWSD